MCLARARHEGLYNQSSKCRITSSEFGSVRNLPGEQPKIIVVRSLNRL